MQELGELHLRATNALKWSSFSHLIQQVLQLTILVFLARLLDPKDFGLIGIVAIFTNFGFLISDLGFGSALIQKKDLKQQHLDTVFSFNILVGFVLTALFIGFAPLVAAFYNEPCLRLVTSMIAVNFIIASLSNTNYALLRKNMSFRKIAIIEMASLAGAGIVSVFFAFKGWGVWCLVLQSLVFQCLRTLTTWLFSNFRPHFKMSRDAITDLFGYGLNITGFNIFNYWVRNADNFLIGKIIGPSALGIYSKAYASMTLPVLQITDVVSNVMFPALSLIQGDLKAVKTIYLKVVRSIALITCPIAIGLFVMARPFVLVVFGDKWIDIIPVLQILCVIGPIQGVSSSVGLIFTSLGRTDLMLKWGIISGTAYLMAFLIGINWGIVGMAIAYVSTGYVVLLYPAWTIPGRLINLTFSEMASNIIGAVICSLMMAIGVWSLSKVLPQSLPLLVSFTMEVILGVMLYAILIHIFQLKAYRELRAIIGYSSSTVLS